jgi:hypothetical protein
MLIDETLYPVEAACGGKLVPPSGVFAAPWKGDAAIEHKLARPVAWPGIGARDCRPRGSRPEKGEEGQQYSI